MTDDVPTIGGAGVAPPAEPGRGDLIGHFVVLDVVGRGASGVVLSAYDPALDRKVAIKLLGARAGDPAELLGEAQAAARLSHPNVVSVYEVGAVGDRVFIAMELVEGDTLEAWLADGPRPRGEILDAFLGAARGLAAAHAAGVVHCDFKPRNVMRGDDGAVRLLDFGIARVASGADEPATAGPAGTPRYMAPEQRRGEAVDARSDQYGFCVALHEALTGHPPDPDGAVPVRGALPAWLARVLARGLAAEPARRFPSMDALIRELARDRRARWRRIGAAMAIALVAGGGAWFAAPRGSAAAACPAPDALLAGVWDGARRARIAAALDARGAASAARRITRDVDAYLASWAAMRGDACTATRVDRRDSEVLLARREACLDQRLRTIGALLDVIDADQITPDRAVEAVQSLPPLAPCADAARLLDDVAPPGPTLAPAVARVRDTIARSHALFWAGRYPEATATSHHAFDQATSIDYVPVQAEATTWYGHNLAWTGDVRDAITQLRAGARLALRSRDYPVAGHAWDLLIYVLGVEVGDRDAGYQAAADAEALLEGLPGSDLALASVVCRRGVLRQVDHDYDHAVADLRHCLEIRTRELGADHPETGFAHYFLADALLDRGDYDGALTHARRALALFRDGISDDHPQVVRSSAVIASALRGRGDPAAAVAILAPLLPRADEILGADPWSIASELHLALGRALADLHRYDAAVDQLRRARRDLDAKAGPDDHRTILAAAYLGRVLVDAGRLDEARPVLEDAVAAAERTFHGNPDLAIPLAAWARWQDAAGHADLALPLFERAATLRVRGDHARPTACELIARADALRARLRLPRSADPARPRCLR